MSILSQLWQVFQEARVSDIVPSVISFSGGKWAWFFLPRGKFSRRQGCPATSVPEFLPSVAEEICIEIGKPNKSLCQKLHLVSMCALRTVGE